MRIDDESNNDQPLEERPITVRQLRQRAICKQRYGRASLTIRRCGTWSDFIGDSHLAKKIEAFRASEATADDVAWAFVRARVHSHSPTFRWEGADLERLIRLVTSCSESPHFEATTAEEIAAELIEAQEAERQSLKRLSDQFSRTFATLAKLPNSFAMSLPRFGGQVRGW
jgi:3',5'-cyclic AMP phosphodiesterase CpdA